MLFFIHLLFAITYLSLISIRRFKLCVVGGGSLLHEIKSARIKLSNSNYFQGGGGVIYYT